LYLTAPDEERKKVWMKKIVESSYEKAVEKIQNQKKTIEDLKITYKKKLRSLQ